MLCLLLLSSGSLELPDVCGNCSLEHAGVELSVLESTDNVGKSLTIPSTAEVVGFALNELWQVTNTESCRITGFVSC